MIKDLKITRTKLKQEQYKRKGSRNSTKLKNHSREEGPEN